MRSFLLGAQTGRQWNWTWPRTADLAYANRWCGCCCNVGREHEGRLPLAEEFDVYLSEKQ